MKFKRFMALALAGVMTLAMAGVSFADDDQTLDSNTPIVEKTVNFNDGVNFPENSEITINYKWVKGPLADTDKFDMTSTINLENGKADYTTGLSSSDLEKFTVPGEYVFTVSEDKGNIVGMTYDEVTKCELHVYKKLGVDGVTYIMKKPKLDGEGNPVTDEDGNQEYEKAPAKFVNKYEPISGDNTDGSVKVTKNVQNSVWSLTDKYEFEVSFKDAKVSKAADIVAKLVEAGLTKKDDTTVKFTLTVSSDENTGIQTLVGIPQGVEYTVKEIGTKDKYGNNWTKCNIKVGNEAEKEGQEYSGKTLADPTTVGFKNIFDNITPTGLAISVAPFVAMFAAVAGAIALYVAAKRRVR